MNYALLQNNIVTNIIYLHPMNAEDFPNAVPIGDYPVAVGDVYAEGQFFRDGKLIRTFAEFVQDEKNDMRAALEMLGVTPDE